MENLTTAAQFLSSIAFFLYGASCLKSKRMIIEFERYRMPQYRFITGLLQLLASVGLVIGFYNPWLALISSLGLALQMLVGVAVRVRIKDSMLATTPAIFFCFLNIFIFYRSYLELQ